VPDKSRPGCAWLTNFQGTDLVSMCDSSFNANEICPATCAGKCVCNDDEDASLIAKNGMVRTCQWVSWMKKFTVRREWCRQNPDALTICPGVCAGWCVFSKT